ncbi:MAG: hypothetical protein ABFS34_13330 [Gemmatimonadota bacterium]
MTHQRHIVPKGTAALALVAVAGLTQAATTLELRAQSLHDAPRLDSEVGLELIRPVFDGLDTNALTFSGQASLRWKVTDKVAVLADLPFTRLSTPVPVTGFGEARSGARLGNPLLGFRYRAADSATAIDVAVRLPIDLQTGDNFPETVGAFGDFDRWEAYMPDLLSVIARASGEWDITEKVVGRFSLGGVLSTTDLGSFGSGGSAYSMTYGGGVSADVGPVTLTPGFTGRLRLDAGSADLAQRTVHQFALGVLYDAVRARPYVRLRVPIDEDLSRIVNLVVSVGVIVPLGGTDER